jgi:thiamine monophosphate kinase
LTLNTAAVLRRTADTTLQECLTDGEDYELLLAVPAERQARMQSAWPFPRTPLTCIGEFRACAEPEISDQTGAPLTLAAYPGYDHLRRTDH